MGNNAVPKLNSKVSKYENNLGTHSSNDLLFSTCSSSTKNQKFSEAKISFSRKY